MAKRPYNSELRQRKHEELKARIAAATAELHAARSASGTSYADIAAQAGVSVPTVYAHFPTQRELLEGCTGHVAAGAPKLPIEDLPNPSLIASISASVLPISLSSCL